jgi:predicted DNA-binding transcriptional regulator AlpA
MPSIAQAVTAEQIGKIVARELERVLRQHQGAVAPEYLTPQQAAQMTGFTARALEAMRSRREGPRYIKSGASIRYRAADIRSWIEQGADAQ